MSNSLECYRCGGSLADLSLPLRRLEECPHCTAELHVCAMCTHYVPAWAQACDVDDAPDVRDKTRANFCDYFEPSPDAYSPDRRGAEAAAEQELAALFGEAAPPTSDAADPEATDPDEQAIERAEALFKK
jgi:hypothetical protein